MKLMCSGCGRDVDQREVESGKRWNRDMYVHVVRDNKAKLPTLRVCGVISMVPDENTCVVGGTDSQAPDESAQVPA